MNLREAKTLAMGLMSQYGLFNWRFKFDRKYLFKLKEV